MNSKSAAIGILLALAASGTAAAQIRLPVIFPLHRSSAPPPPPAPGAVPGNLKFAVGTDTIYFSANGAALDATATATLAAEARWLLANPMVNIRLEGHGGATDSRDYALAIGDRRANAVRDFLVSQGVAPERITVLSWGKERPGKVMIGTTQVAVGPRVVTVVLPPSPAIMPPVQ